MRSILENERRWTNHSFSHHLGTKIKRTLRLHRNRKIKRNIQCSFVKRLQLFVGDLMVRSIRWIPWMDLMDSMNGFDKGLWWMDSIKGSDGWIRWIDGFSEWMDGGIHRFWFPNRKHKRSRAQPWSMSSLRSTVCIDPATPCKTVSS